MNLGSLQFLIACAFAAVVFQSIPWAGPRRFFFTLCNAAFLFTLVPNLVSWYCLAGFLVGTYALVKLAGIMPSRWVVALGLVVVLGAFVVLKQYAFAMWFLPAALVWDQELIIVEVVGLSYVLFKFIHVFVDQAQGQLAPITLLRYANYQLAFFTITAGPIQRLQ